MGNINLYFEFKVIKIKFSIYKAADIINYCLQLLCMHINDRCMIEVGFSIDMICRNSQKWVHIHSIISTSALPCFDVS